MQQAIASMAMQMSALQETVKHVVSQPGRAEPVAAPPRVQLPEEVKSVDDDRTPWDQTFDKAKKHHVAAFERDYFRKLLRNTNYDIPKAADISGISSRTIYRMINRRKDM